MTAHDSLLEIPSSEWADHPLLGGLESGSDLDGDGAWFVTWENSPIPMAAMAAIRVEERADQDPWTPAARADGSSFPSRDWAIAAVGWYRPIWSFMSPEKAFETRALVPASWDVSHPMPQRVVPQVPYFSDWRTRTWLCDCGWQGSNRHALVFHDQEKVSIACPECAHGLATIDRRPSSEEVEAAAALGNPEALAMRSPDDYGDAYIGGEGEPLFVAGHEQVVYFDDGDQFFGVPDHWLLPRLRLNPESMFVDLFERSGFHVCIDNELIEAIEPSIALGEYRGELCSYGNGDIIGGRYDLYEEWVEAWAVELRWNFTWVDLDSVDLRSLALEKISEGMESWEPDALDTFEVTSPYLDPRNPTDVEDVLALAGEAGRVSLNEVTIRS